MPVEGEHEPSAQAWVCDPIELDEGSGGGTKKDEKVVDAEYTEVDDKK